MIIVEIERKFTIKTLPEHLEQYAYHEIEQGYLSTSPVVRVRKEDDIYYLTYKGQGLLAREESNLPLTQASYEHLLLKADGIVITKRRYLIPYLDGLTIELDLFRGALSSLIVAEVEFMNLKAANTFIPPDWFQDDVTEDSRYSNSSLSQHGLSLLQPSV